MERYYWQFTHAHAVSAGREWKRSEAFSPFVDRWLSENGFSPDRWKSEEANNAQRDLISHWIREEVHLADQGKVSSPHAPDTEPKNPVNDPLRWSCAFEDIRQVQDRPTKDALRFLLDVVGAQQLEIEELRKDR